MDELEFIDRSEKQKDTVYLLSILHFVFAGMSIFGILGILIHRLAFQTMVPIVEKEMQKQGNKSSLRSVGYIECF